MKSKQVIVIRKDLNMRKGKMVAQGAHASMKVILDMMIGDHDGNFKYMVSEGKKDEVTYNLKIEGGSALQNWILGIFTKVCVSVNSEQELLELYEKAKSMNIPCSLITDAGLTEFDGVATNTSIAIGPGWEEDINQITGHLPLL